MKAKQAFYFITVLLFIPVFTTFGQTLPEDGIDKYIKFERISENVLLVKAGVNYFDAVTAIATRKGIVIFDTGLSPTLTAKYRKIIEREFKRNDFVYIVLTHSDQDHTGGNQVFPEAQIIAQERCPVIMSANSRDMSEGKKIFNNYIDELKTTFGSLDRNSEKWKQTDYQLQLALLYTEVFGNNFHTCFPSIIFSDKLSINMGNITLKLFYFGTAHTNNDVVIYVPEEHLLLNGDLFVFGGDDDLRELRNNNVVKEDVNRWCEIMDTLAAPGYNVEKILTGHGYLLNKNDFTEFHNKVKLLKNAFNSGKEVSAKVILSKTLADSGIAGMASEYRRITSDPKSKFYFLEKEFNDWGLSLLNGGKIGEAIAVFKINVDQFPESARAYDSLGSAYAAEGNKEPAIINYEKSLKLNPDNINAENALKKLKDK